MTPTTLLAEVVKPLNIGGWIMMIGCVGLVLGLLGFCLYRVCTQPTTKTGGCSNGARDADEEDGSFLSGEHIVCGYCGKPNRRSATYCAHCGQPLR